MTAKAPWMVFNIQVRFQRLRGYYGVPSRESSFSLGNLKQFEDQDKIVVALKRECETKGIETSSSKK
jgi:hypothetical protein